MATKKRKPQQKRSKKSKTRRKGLSPGLKRFNEQRAAAAMLLKSKSTSSGSSGTSRSGKLIKKSSTGLTSSLPKAKSLFKKKARHAQVIVTIRKKRNYL